MGVAVAGLVSPGLAQISAVPVSSFGIAYAAARCVSPIQHAGGHRRLVVRGGVFGPPIDSGIWNANHGSLVRYGLAGSESVDIDCLVDRHADRVDLDVLLDTADIGLAVQHPVPGALGCGLVDDSVGLDVVRSRLVRGGDSVWFPAFRCSHRIGEECRRI